MSEHHSTGTDRARTAAARAWNNLRSRAGGKYNHGQCYAHVEVRMAREEFMGWAVPEYEKWFAGRPDEKPSIDRIDSAGHYELSNIRLVPLPENRRRTKTLRRDYAPEGTQWCCRHQEYLPREQFPGPSSGYCNACCNEHSRQARKKAGAAGRAKNRAKKREYHSTPRGAAVKAWNHFLERKGIVLAMTQDEFFAWAVPEYGRWLAEKPHEVPTVKRLDPDGPYSVGNLVLVPRSASRLSRNLGAPEGMRFCPACELPLPLDNFFRSKGKPFGYCKPCAKERRRGQRSE